MNSKKSHHKTATLVLLSLVASFLVAGSATATGSLSFSQTNISLSTNQNPTITISGGSGAYYVSSSTSPDTIQTNIAGSSLTLHAVGSSGSATITICEAITSMCGTITATINGSGSDSGSGISFSQSNLTLATGSNQQIAIYGNGSYALSSNSNASVVSASLNGNILSVSALSQGTATLTVCQQTGGCGSVSITVSATGSSNTLAFSQNNPTITVGQQITVTVSGGTGVYSLSTNSNPAIVGATLSGNVLAISGSTNGSTVLTVCDTGNVCGNLNVSVSAGSASQNTGLTFGQNPVSVIKGQTAVVSISEAGGYFISKNQNAGVAYGAINGNSVVIYSVSTGSTTITICGSGGQCGTLTVNSGEATGSSTNTQSTNASLDVTTLLAKIDAMQNQLTQLQTQLSDLRTAVKNLVVGVSGSTNTSASVNLSTSSNYKFYSPLGLGDQGEEVKELQKRLTAEGLFSGDITGYYGSQTEAAVKKYQTLHGLTPLGNIGPGTRAVLNK